MTMLASTAKNRCLRDVNNGPISDGSAAIDTTVTFKQGDILCLDTTAHLLKAIAADADTATLVGVAPCGITLGLLASALPTAVDGAQALSAIGGPQVGTFSMKLKSGDTFNFGSDIWVDTSAAGDAQTVTSSRPGTQAKVGFYVGKTVTAAAGDEGPVYIGNRYNSRSPAATVAANATTAATDLTTAEALANSLQTTVNAILTSLKAAGVML